MAKILVLQGVPASGKTTWAKEFVTGREDWVIISKDSIRESTGNYWVPSRENYISEVEELQVKSAIKNNLNIILDSTNLNPKVIEKWKNLAEETNSEIEFKPFKIDFKTALERDGNRPRPVGKKVLEDFFSRYFPEELKSYYTDHRKFIEHDPDKEDCIVVDLDGTIAIHTGRSFFDWARVGEDIPNIPLIKILKQLNKDYRIIFLTGRTGTSVCVDKTGEWLTKYFGAPNEEGTKGWTLIMRAENDFRHSNIVKEELYHQFIEPEYNVIAAYDDSDKIVKMWRDLGILCNQVYYDNC